MNTKAWVTHSRRFLVYMGSAALLSSCMAHNYPASNWALPSTLPDGLCPDISGKYFNSGQSSESQAPAYLYCELIISAPGSCSITQAKQIEQITIAKSGSELIVSAWRSGSMVASETRTWSQETYRCEGGWIILKSKEGRGFSSPVADFSTLYRSFAISEGHLLEKRRTESLYLVSVIPIANSTTSWYRYFPAEGPNNSLEDRRP